MGLQSGEPLVLVQDDTHEVYTPVNGKGERASQLESWVRSLLCVCGWGKLGYACPRYSAFKVYQIVSGFRNHNGHTLFCSLTLRLT